VERKKKKTGKLLEVGGSRKEKKRKEGVVQN
jgi:hypothetical protein